MILEAFIALSSFGFGVWLLGEVAGRPDVAVVGAIIVLGLGGATITGDGIEVRTGINQTTTANGSTVEYVHEPVQTQSQFRLELLVIALGALMLLKSLEEISEL